ncbi:MAG TPA: flagellar protein FlaG [Candidatus Baltobacteraceae bacterium]|nr:flagellar protein FlaG [Candidatus Baltobacteraceae bacterium]
MDVRVAGAAEAPAQQAPPASASQHAGGLIAQGKVADAPHPQSGVLSPVVAKLFAGGIPQPLHVNVSYRVEHDPNMVVTVFTDPSTGQEIAQIPAEVMVQIAQFFDKQSGVTLDRSA